MVGMIHNSGAPLTCCGEHMTELVANTVDASLEKHVPVATVEGNTVTVNVGSVDHPMVEEHYITWIYLRTDKGGHRICLKPGEAPRAVFSLVDENRFPSLSTATSTAYGRPTFKLIGKP
jgi:superoxide reductase